MQQTSMGNDNRAEGVIMVKTRVCPKCRKRTMDCVLPVIHKTVETSQNDIRTRSTGLGIDVQDGRMAWNDVVVNGNFNPPSRTIETFIPFLLENTDNHVRLECALYACRRCHMVTYFYENKDGMKDVRS